MRDIVYKTLLVLLNVVCLIPALMILALVAIAKAARFVIECLLDAFVEALKYFADLETDLKARYYKENKSEETQRTV